MNNLKTLIVEDDKSVQLLYDKALPSDVFEKRFCENGVEALEIYESWNPDIIILDVFLPIMTGYSVLKAIRKEFKDKKSTIIMATSLKNEEHIKDCMKLGIQGYIVKPFKYRKVYEAIHNKITEYYQRHKSNEENTSSSQMHIDKKL
jgi:DNA-binding response OmpR family regulator